ncbi:MAG: MFS transporter [Kiritimatiellae bacterium]|nr:MFS transporter [Kiritimatiellia bacterium]
MDLARRIAALRRRKEAAFRWLNATQFLGAFNDNLFKGFVTMFLILLIPEWKGFLLGGATILFAIPFLCFTAYAGFLADRFPKNRVTVALKYAELAVMSLAVPLFWFSSPWLLFAVLFLMSLQSALFSPTKYGIVPELVKKERLTEANSVLVMWSYLAIIAGAAAAPGAAWLLRAKLGLAPNGAYTVSQLLCVVVAVAGVLASTRVWRLPPANPRLHPDLLFVRRLWRTTAWVRRDPHLVLAMAGTGLFSLVASFLQIDLVAYGVNTLGLSTEGAQFQFFYAAIGIAVGAWIAGRLSRRNVEMGLMPVGAGLLALGVFGIALRPSPSTAAVAALVFSAGVGAGMFVVPLDTFLQMRLPADRRGEGLALNSFVSWIGVLLAGLAMVGGAAAGLTARQGVWAMFAASLLLFAGALWTLRDFFVRMLVTIAVKSLYRVRTIGIENLPVDGPALLLANHSSYFDALLLCATTRRRIRFLMDPAMIERFRWLKPFLRLYRVIPVSSRSSPSQVARALREARRALDEGYMVCVFPEGGVTRTGTIRAFHRGYERIVRGSDYPLVPIYLGGSWGTMYAYYGGQFLNDFHRPRLTRYPVTVVFGKPLPTHTDAFRVRRAVMELSCDWFNSRKDEHASLGETTVRTCRRYWRQPFADDTNGVKLTWGRSLVGGLVIAREIERRTRGSEHVGILLPSCCPAMLCNVAVALLGKSAVNLNFTVGTAAFASAIRQCNLTTILTSRKFVERFPDLPVPAGTYVFLEDLMKDVSTAAKLGALLRAKFLPLRAMVRSDRTGPDSIAMVLFSSGSTGEPKGVMLSHHAVLSEVEALRMLLATSTADHMCAVLPFFHSFGLVGCLWYPLLTHVRATYHPNPLDAQTVIDIVRTRKSTLVWGTPTFLQLYQRRAKPEDFATLRVVLAGGEKLKDSLIQAYVEKFGVRPLEAYGATEMAPGIAVSVPPGTGGGVVQAGYKEGRTGVPCPGIAMKIVDPDTGAELGPNEPGLLYLRGPNVMLGYLGRQDLTDEVIDKDGWYCTGDIAFVDEDGFVALTDRLSRFSKIGGEMVPHQGVEEAIVSAAGLEEGKIAVTGVPDERKGEKLVVLYTPDCGDPAWLQQALDGVEGIPNLWKPAPADWHRVDAIPLLGTGKIDLGAVKKLARDIETRGTAESRK